MPRQNVLAGLGLKGASVSLGLCLLSFLFRTERDHERSDRDDSKEKREDLGVDDKSDEEVAGME